jgi:hypothetical protein
MNKYKDEVTCIHVNCDCGCSVIEIRQAKDKHGYSEVFIGHKIESFYALQRPGWSKFREMVKAIRCFLSGKEYYFYDVVLIKGKQIAYFKKAVAKLHEDVYYEK